MRSLKAFILLLLSTPGLCQLAVRSNEKFDFNRHVSKTSKGTEFLLSNFSGRKIQFLQRNSTFVKSVPNSERVLSVSDDGLIYSLSGFEAGSEVDLILKSYENIRGAISLKHSLTFSSSVSIATFNNGAFAVIELGEDGGRKIDFFSSDFSLINEYIPFDGGYSSVNFTVENNQILLYAMPNQPATSPSLILMTSGGQLIFQKALLQDHWVSSILCSSEFQAISYFSDGNHISVFSKSGSLLWTRSIDNAVANWRFTGDQSTVVVTTHHDLYLIDIKNGAMIGRIKLTDIYDNAGMSRTRRDNYIQTLGIESMENSFSFSLLLAEPMGEQDFRNVLLCSFRSTSVNDRQVNKIGNVQTSPILRSADKTFMVIYDNTIQKYEY